MIWRERFKFDFGHSPPGTIDKNIRATMIFSVSLVRVAAYVTGLQRAQEVSMNPRFHKGQLVRLTVEKSGR